MLKQSVTLLKITLRSIWIPYCYNFGVTIRPRERKEVGELDKNTL